MGYLEVVCPVWYSSFFTYLFGQVSMITLAINNVLVSILIPFSVTAGCHP